MEIKKEKSFVVYYSTIKFVTYGFKREIAYQLELFMLVLIECGKRGIVVMHLSWKQLPCIEMVS